jgi:hypothetical protein
VELIGNKSSLLKEKDRLLKNSEASIRSLKNSKDGVG